AQNAPVLNAGTTIRQAYCPQAEIKIAEFFTIEKSLTGSDTGIDSFSIQISSGYSEGSDLLKLDLLDHPNIEKNWSTVEGKLKLTPKIGTQILYGELQKAVREVIFTSSSGTISGEKYFSLTIGDANYLPSTQHFYEYIDKPNITWQDARDEAKTKTYYGLQGYLATILSEEENQISAKQIIGAGWIGANDENKEGEWRWVTGPEGELAGGNGLNFWNGEGSGSAAIDPFTGNPMYSNWFAPVEPNDAGNEDYAHIKENASTWNDLKNGGGTGEYRAKGYIIEYGGMPGDDGLQISASTSIYVPEITSFDPVLRNCTGETMTFTATVSEGEIYWYDAPIGGNLVKTGDTFTTPSLTSSKNYYIAASPKGCATTARIEVKAIIDTTPVVMTPPLDINRCDDNRDGFIDFDLQADETPIIFAGLDPILNPDLTEFEILYFDDPLDANANITAAIIDNPYRVDTSDNPTIYARVQNITAPNTCFAITSFKLKVTDTPTPTDPSDYRLCDDTVSGSDIDEKSSFLLNTKDAEILTGVTNPGECNISYHTDLADAQTSSTTNAIPKDIDYEVTTSQTVYVRIENNNDPTQCYTVSDDSAGSLFTSFKLIVDPLPVVNSGIEIDYCIVTGDPNPTVDLTQAEDEVSPTTGARFEYFKDSSGLIPILNPVSYPPVGNVFQIVFVKVFSDKDCPRDLVKLKLNIGEVSDTPYNDLVAIECDDFLDKNGINTPGMNDDTDNITNFNLNKTTLKSNIYASGGGVIPNSDIFFYESISDRNNNKFIPDIANYRNDPTNIDITNIPAIGISFPIYYKILSTINNDCQGIGQFYLQINAVPIANTPANFELCDDELSGNTTDGINNGINLSDINRVNDILGPSQIGLSYVVTFHTSQADADDPASMGIPNDNSFTNTPQAGFTAGDISEQTIFVRVKNTAGCISNSTSFKIIVNPIPSISTTITPLAVCDLDADPRNRIAQNIDLTTKSAEILTGKTNHRVAYYLTQPDAQNIIEISNPTDFQNGGVLPDGTALTKFPTDFNTDDPAIQTIFFKIIDLGGNKCASIINTFRLVIYPEPNIPLNISNYSDCDNITDSDADDANGKIGNITLKNKIPEILANYQPTEFADFAVRFYASLTGAEIGDPANALNENTFENSTNGQEIFVRVENIKNTPIVCVNTRLSFNININPLPDFTVRGEENIEDPLIVCLNDTPLTLEAENPVATYAYQWTNQAGDLLGTTATQEVFDAGKYTVTASESVTGCSRERTIVVKESDIATLEQSFITIIDQGNNIGSEDKSSISIDTISNYLGLGDYQFALRNDDENTTTLFQDEPLFENLKGAIYTIIVNDKNGCEPDTTLQVSVLQFPKFFTPNGDGRNDTYRVKGANKTFYPNSSINIFNRYGKLVAQIPIDSQGWDGTYNGKKLSSDDYWYNITLIPADNTKQIINKTGNFSLLRK
ncbi:T9SS type B sorting domain-containing protein, partial [Polaribacter sp.]|nr:T9SS type B sorting domain-containing protein [Polaribacter sp.]